MFNTRQVQERFERMAWDAWAPTVVYVFAESKRIFLQYTKIVSSSTVTWNVYCIFIIISKVYRRCEDCHTHKRKIEKESREGERNKIATGRRAYTLNVYRFHECIDRVGMPTSEKTKQKLEKYTTLAQFYVEIKFLPLRDYERVCRIKSTRHTFMYSFQNRFGYASMQLIYRVNCIQLTGS